MKHGRTGSRVTTALLTTGAVLALAIGGAGVWVWFAKPIQQAQARVVPILETHTAEPAPASTGEAAPARQCEAGMPEHFTWLDLGIKNAPTEMVGTKAVPGQGRVLQAPVRKDTIGVYREKLDGNAVGNLPGQGRGNIITEMHTFDDGSAILKADADKYIRTGSVFSFAMDNGSVCEYQITRVFHELKKDKPAAQGHELFADVSKREGFYDLNRTGEQLVGLTCSGDLDSDRAHHLYETVWVAKPIN